MAISVSECSLVITSITEPKCTVKVTLTSPTIREEDSSVVKDGKSASEAKKGIILIRIKLLVKSL